MSARAFADMVYQSLAFNEEDPAARLVLELIDTPWVQRLRDISQTANTRLVYMFSEHSRFGHSLGVAYMALEVMDKLAKHYPNDVAEYKSAIAAAALLHDLGHIAPGSHHAQKAWFPEGGDKHELGTIRIITEDPQVNKIIASYDPSLAKLICRILSEDSSLPPWTWQIISGSGWNVDRGNWCIVDSILAGVNYGKYNIPALTDSLMITPEKELAITENRIDAMMHFAVSRHAMYRQIYQHRVLLSADTIATAIVKRLRNLGNFSEFADSSMLEVIASNNYDNLSLNCIFHMRESWWRYHTTRWLDSKDKILADLCDRLLNRRLFKTIRIDKSSKDLISNAKQAVIDAGYDPEYYLHTVSTADVLSRESIRTMPVIKDDGKSLTLGEADPIFNTLVSKGGVFTNKWLCLPEEVKNNLGIKR